MRRVALLLIACTLGPAAMASADEVSLSWPGCCSGQDFRIKPSDSLKWTGGIFSSHPLVSTEGRWTTVSSGSEFSHTFDAAGIFHFYCQIHGTPSGAPMGGVVKVTANRAPAAAFTPTSGTVDHNASVTFTNHSTDPDAGQALTYAWDLDGDNQFDDSTAASPSAQYQNNGASNRTITVRLRTTDSNADAIGPESSTATGTVTIRPAPATGGGGGGGGGTEPPPPPAGGGGGGGGGGDPPVVVVADPDRTAPKVTIAATTLTFRAGRSAVGLVLGEAGTVTVSLKVGALTLATGKVTAPAAGSRRVGLKLTPAGARRLKKRRRLTGRLSVTARDAAGNAATLTKTMTVRR